MSSYDSGFLIFNTILRQCQYNCQDLLLYLESWNVDREKLAAVCLAVDTQCLGVRQQKQFRGIYIFHRRVARCLVLEHIHYSNTKLLPKRLTVRHSPSLSCRSLPAVDICVIQTIEHVEMPFSATYS
jgi:hypothetical protein